MTWRELLRSEAQTIALAGCAAKECPRGGCVCGRCNTTIIALLMMASGESRPRNVPDMRRYHG